VIKDGVNGQLFPLEATGEDYADWILNTMSSPARYRELALRAAEHAAAHLSWKVSGEHVARILHDVVRNWSGTPAQPQMAEQPMA
jgi:hypothetical protein